MSIYKQVDNLGRLAIIGSHIKLRIIANKRIEAAFNEEYNIGNSIKNSNPPLLY